MEKREGMTLIEVIISIMLLSMISIAILPISAYSMKYTKWNNIKLNALNLAYSQVEWLKTLNYEDLGLVGESSPAGTVENKKYINETDPVKIDGVEYTVNTGIYWEKATSTTGELVAQAMKKIDVTVEARDLNTGGQREYAVLGTLVSREGERNFIEPGYVIVRVYLRNDGSSAENVKVKFVSPEKKIKYSKTDKEGEVLFGMFDGKVNWDNYKKVNYTMEVTSWKYTSLMVKPNAVKDHKDWKTSKEVTVDTADKRDSIQYPGETFIIDLPGYIRIAEGSGRYPKDAAVLIKPTGESYIPPAGERPDHMTLTSTVGDIGDIKFWRLWNYDYILTRGREEFFLEGIDAGTIWDGKFDVSKLDQESHVKVDLKFGIKDGNISKDIDPTRPTQIMIDFTSNIHNYEDIEFELNKLPIPKENYVVTQPEGNDYQVSIELDPAIEIGDENIEFEISNYEAITNSYGMSLAQEKSMTTISNP